MSKDSEKMAIATVILEYKDMREKIIKIFGEPGLHTVSWGVPSVKETVLYGHSLLTNDPGSSRHDSFKGRSYRERDN